MAPKFSLQRSYSYSYRPKTTSNVSQKKPSLSWKSIVTVFMIFSITSLFIWVLDSIEDPPPDVFIDYLKVSNFEVLDSKLVAEWVAKLTLYKYIPTSPPNNRPVKSDIPLFKRVEAFIAYKEHILAFNSTNVEPKWGWLGLRSLTVKFSTGDLEGEDQMEVEDWVLEDIRKDKDNGAVTFGMEIVVWTQGYQRSFWAQCPKLRVDFNQPTWEATWPNDCHVSKWYHPLNTLYR